MKKQLIIASAILLIAIAISGAVSAADTTWSISASPDPIKSGQVLTYTITITNNGQDILIWPGIDVLGLSPDLINPQVSWDGSDWIGCNLEQHYGFSSISPGSSKTIYFRGTVKETTASSISSIFNLIDIDGNILDQKNVTTIVKQNQAPVPVWIGPITANEGSVIFDATGSSDPDGDTLQYRWKINDGQWSDWSTSPKITFNLDDMVGTYWYEVSDGKITLGTCSTVTVNNVAPTALAGDDQTAIVGNAVSFSGSFTDPGTDDTHTYSWDFGDGSAPVTGTLTPTHTYTKSGTYNVKLTIKDDDGGVGTDIMKVTVNPITVTADIKPGATPNTISIKSKGVIPVAILSTSTFDASNVNPSSVTFGRTGNEKSFVKYSWTDVNGDGKIDLLLYFDAKKTGLTLSDTEAILKGLTTTGLSFECRDSIKTVPK